MMTSSILSIRGMATALASLLLFAPHVFSESSREMNVQSQYVAGHAKAISSLRAARAKVGKFKGGTKRFSPLPGEDPHDGSSKGRRMTPQGALGAPEALDETFQASQASFSSVLDSMMQCQDSCQIADPAALVGNTSGVLVFRANDSTEDNDKPSCCIGGVSALKMVYHGPQSVELFTPSYASLTAYDRIDPCGDAAKGGSKGTSSPTDVSIYFVSCDRCFPSSGPSTTCDPQSDVWGSNVYAPGDHVCVASVSTSTNTPAPDAKFPTNIDFYYLPIGSGDNEIRLVPLHTSCSQPIYSPYGIQLGICKAQSGYLVDTSGKNETELSASPLLTFLDGVSAQNPSALLSQCDKPQQDTCCKGGVTILKTRLGNASGNGTVTTDASQLSTDEVLCDEYDRPTSKGKGKGHDSKRSSSSRDFDNSSVAFVPCDDSCLDPFSAVNCTNATRALQVTPEDDICIVSWNIEDDTISFLDKMPTNLEIYFVPDDNSSSLIATIHTSCSRPVYPPYGQTFSDDCTKGNSDLVNLETANVSELPMYLGFVDGISRRYLEAVDELDGHGLPFYDFTFAGCGCQCGGTPTSAPTRPSPGSSGPPPTTAPETANPSFRPSLSPTVGRTPQPTTNPTPNATPAPTTGATSAPTGGSTPSPTLGLTPSPTPGPTPSPSNLPTTTPVSGFPTDEPTPGPTAAPTPEPTPAPTPGTSTPTAQPSLEPTASGPLSCLAECEAWVKENCILLWDDGSVRGGCDVNLDLGEDGGRLLRSSATIEYQWHILQRLEDEVDGVEYHDGMAALYGEILTLLELASG